MVPEASNLTEQMIGDYEIVEKIAEGGMGTVYKARHRTTGEVVALKMVAPHMATNPTYLQRFEKEYNAARALDHPNIVRALEHGVIDGRPYLVMEFVEGESLGQRLDRVGRIPEAEAVRIIIEAAQALHQAHQRGMIHRDVKPDNIMVTPDGRVKLADLGLVKELDGDLNLTRTGRGLGTPHFMAPEQFRNAKNANVRCDIYSLAATLYMMVTGQMPFAACPPLDAFMKKLNDDLPAPRKLVPGLSAQVDAAIRAAMSADPDKRPATCQEFIEDLNGTGSRKLPQGTPAPTSPDAWWYLKYTDEEGMLHTVKGTVSGIRRALKEGRLGDARNVEACSTKKGPFHSLGSLPQFRDLVEAILAERRKNARTPEDLATSPTELLPAMKRDRKAAVEQPGTRPHFRLEAAPSNTLEWMKLFLIIIFAVGGGVLAALYLQK
jgi:serine/threonine protein kinase